MDILRRFQGDVGTREAVQDFLTNFIADEGVRLMFERKDVSHIADAKMLIDSAFNELHTLYGIKQEPTEKTDTSR
jgi:hypothetical protein